MMRRALLLLMLPALAAVARGDAAEGAATPTPEQADLAAVQVAELAAEAQAGGVSWKVIGNLDQAFVGLEAKYPRSVAVRLEHGNFLQGTNRRDEALAKWQQAEKLDGNNAALCQCLGMYWLDCGDTPRGTGYLERAVALAPGNALMHFNLGNGLYLFRHDLTTPRMTEVAVVDRALAELRKASELEPLETDYALGYADTFYAIPVANWPEALRAWQHFYDITPDKNFAAINLARVSLQMKDKAGARKYLDRVNGAGFEGLKKKLMAQASGGNAE